MSIQYVQCCDCKTIHREGALPVDFGGRIRGTPYCPTCSADEFVEVTGVCDECQRHFKVPDDDLCQNCLDVEADALIDIVMGETDQLYRKAS